MPVKSRFKLFSFLIASIYFFSANVHAAGNIPTQTGQTAINNVAQSIKAAQDAAQQEAKCQQKQAQTPPQPCVPEKPKQGMDLGQLAAALAGLASALGTKKSASGLGAASTPDFNFDNPEDIKTAFKGLGANDKEVRDVLKGKELLDKAKENGELAKYSSADGGGVAGAAPSSEAMKEAEAELAEFQKRAEAAIEKNFPHLTLGGAEGGGGGGGGAAAAAAEEPPVDLAEIEEDEPFKLDLPAPEDSTLDFGGDELGPKHSNIFDNLSRRYQLRQTAGKFLP